MFVIWSYWNHIIIVLSHYKTYDMELIEVNLFCKDRPRHTYGDTCTLPILPNNANKHKEHK